MKRFEFIGIVLLFASVLLLCSDGEKEEKTALSTPINPTTDVLISKIETSFDGGQTRLPYGEYFYDENNQIKEAIIWRYNKTTDGKIEPAEYTYTFARNGNTIGVTCTEWGDKEEYTEYFELETNECDQVVKKTKYESGKKIEIVNYEWSADNKLIQQVDSSEYNNRGDTTILTYDLMGNVESHTARYLAPVYSGYVERYCDSTVYEHNAWRRNVFSLYPVELAVVEEESPEIYMLGVSENEVVKYMVNKSYTGIHPQRGKVFDVLSEEIADYTFEYNDYDLPQRAMVDILHHRKYRDAEKEEEDDRYMNEYSMLFFSYIYR